MKKEDTVKKGREGHQKTTAAEMLELASIPGANIPLGYSLENIQVKNEDIGQNTRRGVVGLTLQDDEGWDTGVEVVDIRKAVVAAAEQLLAARAEVAELCHGVSQVASKPDECGALMAQIQQKNVEISEIKSRLRVAIYIVPGVKLYRKGSNFLVAVGDTDFRLPEGQKARMTLSVMEVPISDKIGKAIDAAIVGRAGVVKAMVDPEKRVIRFAAIHGETFCKEEKRMKTAGGRATVAVVCDYTGATQIIRVAANRDSLQVTRNLTYEPPAKVVPKPAENEESVGSADDGRTFRNQLGQKKLELEVKATMDAVREAIGKLAPDQRATLVAELVPPAPVEKKRRERKQPPKALAKAKVVGKPETKLVPVPATADAAANKLQQLVDEVAGGC